ncbi:MAG: DUF924 family protein [Pseudomonadota bacterium]
MTDTQPEAEAVLQFWLVETDEKMWWSASEAFDAQVRIRFAKTLKRAEKSELWTWRTTPRGRVAEIIVLDQFSRQLYRKSGRAFANDTLALALAQELVAQNLHTQLEHFEKHFALMPYMHTESLAVHDEAMKLYAEVGEKALDFEKRHRDVIKRFGRYPKRNEALGRLSTAAELEYIAATGNSMF